MWTESAPALATYPKVGLILPFSTRHMVLPTPRSVQIYGKFDVLAPGITLVDLPGQGDANDERYVFVSACDVHVTR